jgi:hypothetical protein
MPHTPSVMRLHLRYRLWIAEMNFDIDMLRIFEDYQQELLNKKDEPEVKTGIDYFENQFILLRKDIDELRHEMHLLKMKLAAYLREAKPVNYKTYQTDNHTELKNRYLTFRRKMDNVKNEFEHFEGKWLN